MIMDPKSKHSYLYTCSTKSKKLMNDYEHVILNTLKVKVL